MKQLGLPLLTKELIEQSTRKRTYVVRFLFAVVLYVTAIYFFYDQFGSWNSGFSILGKGRTLFQSLAWLEFGAIYFFLPAMTCGVLTSEKERDTFALLLITKLGPWTIILEKLLSRLIPMATFSLIAMPLLAIAYSIGGVEANDIGKLMWLLAVTAFQIGTFALLCSSWFRTTGGAFIAAYLAGPLVLIASGVFFYLGNYWIHLLLGGWLSIPTKMWLFESNNQNVMFLAFAPAILNGGEITSNFRFTTAVAGPQTPLDCIVMSLPMIGMSILNLALARAVLWRRAFLRPTNLMMRIFQQLDQFFRWANNNWLTAGVEFFPGSVTLPTNQPISWRETSKRPLGTVRYLIRILLLLEIPLLFMIVLMSGAAEHGAVFAYFRYFEWCLWATALLILVIQSTGLIAVERSRQTLDVLLTTPLTSDQIVRQKMAGVQRMIRILWVPFVTFYCFKIWRNTWPDAAGSAYSPDPLSIFEQTIFDSVRAVFAVGLYLPTIVCIGFQAGIRSRSQLQAVLSLLTILTGICFVPFAIGNYLMIVTNRSAAGGSIVGDHFTIYLLALSIGWISPLRALTALPYHPITWLCMLLHFGAVASICYWLANSTTKVFSDHVGRCAKNLDENGVHENGVHSVLALKANISTSRLDGRQIGIPSDHDTPSSEKK